MKKRITNCLLVAAMLSATAGVFVSCKDYDGDSAWNERTAQNTSLIEALTQQVNSLKTAQANCKAQCRATQDSLAAVTKVNEAAINKNATDIKTSVDALTALINQNSTDIAANKASIQTAEQAIAQHKDAIDLLNQTVAANGRTIAQNSADIISLTARVQALESADQVLDQKINTLSTTLNTRTDSVVNAINEVNLTVLNVLNKVNTLDATLASALVRLTNVEATAGEALTKANDNKTLISTLQGTVTGLETQVAELFRKALADSTLAAQAYTLADSAAKLANENLDKINAQNVTIANLEQAYKDADKVLKNQIDALSSRVEALENAYKKQVTSIMVNGAINPLFGYYAVPTGDVRSTIVAAYYGTPAQFQFPTANAGYYADATSKLSAVDLDITGVTSETLGGGTIVTEDGAVGNAGTVYMTLNPVGTPLDGKTFALVNSQGEASPVTLSAVKSSDAVLNFGYTRANTNGFYESQATVKAADVQSIKPAVNLGELKEAATTLLKELRHNKPLSLTKISSLVYNNMTNVLPALALKTTWNDGTGNQSVLSQYVVAATAVKPLSFSSLRNISYRIPTISALQQLNLNIKNITVEKLTGSDYNIVVENASGDKTKYTAEGVDKLVDDLNKRRGDLEKDVNEQIDNAENKLNNKGNNYVNKANSLISKYNKFANRFNHFIAHINDYLQPSLLCGKGDAQLYQVSGTPYGADALATGSSLLLTTHSFEYLAPAYKKWIAVTNVWENSNDAVKDVVLNQSVTSAQNGSAALQAALRAANGGENMNKVVFGTIRHAKLGTLQSGKVYEISYSAVDYSGKVAARKYYVRGK